MSEFFFDLSKYSKDWLLSEDTIIPVIINKDGNLDIITAPVAPEAPSFSGKVEMKPQAAESAEQKEAQAENASSKPATAGSGTSAPESPRKTAGAVS